MSKVSVIIPTYNREKVILDSLKSVVNQSLAPDEIIIVDDGSTDNTKKVVEEYIRGVDIPCKLIDNRRAKGVSGARNTGILESTGELLAFLDSDDLWLPKKLEEQVAVIGNHGLCYCDHYFFIEYFSEKIAARKNIPLKQGEFLLELLKSSFLIPSSVIVTRDKVLEVGMFQEELRTGEDFAFFLKLSCVTTTACVSSELVAKRISRDSLAIEYDRVVVGSNIMNMIMNVVARSDKRWALQDPEVRKVMYKRFRDLAYDACQRGLIMTCFINATRALRFGVDPLLIKVVFKCIPVFIFKSLRIQKPDRLPTGRRD